MASSAEICGSGGNAAACGSRLSLAGTAVCPAGSADFRNHSFIKYMLEVNKIGSIESREHFKNILPKCGLNEEKRTLLRREKLGFVFQAYELLYSLTVTENIRLPELEANADYVGELLEALGIRQYETCYPDQLSGGEQQRVAIARALINHPLILFADEPTGNLDSKTERIVVDLLKNLAEKYGTSILMVTHNEDLVKDADRVIRLEDGEIVNG